jgi:hypothetical protein
MRLESHDLTSHGNSLARVGKGRRSSQSVRLSILVRGNAANSTSIWRCGRKNCCWSRPILGSPLPCRRARAKLANVQVVCQAVAGHPGPAVFHRYNLPGTCSLHPASGLLRLFPGLKPLDELPLEAVGPATLIEPLQMVAQADNLLDH